MTQGKKRMGRAAACILLAALLTGCMDTPEDECIVREKGTETGETSFNIEAEENISIAEQVGAKSHYEQEIKDGLIDVEIRADVTIPDGNSMKIYEAESRYFDQSDLDGWVKLLTQGQPLRDYNTGNVIKWKTQAELFGVVEISDIYAAWDEAEKRNYLLELSNTQKGGRKAARLELRREENGEYLPWSRTEDWENEKTRISRKQMKKAAESMLATLGLSEEFQYKEAEPVYCMVENVCTDSSSPDYGGLITEENKGWRFYFTRRIDGASLTHAANHSLDNSTLEELSFDLESCIATGADDYSYQSGGYEETISDAEGSAGVYYREELQDWDTSEEGESFSITFDDEGLVDVTWQNPCRVVENEGDGIFLLPFSDILQVFQKSITKQYILELFAHAQIPVKARVTEIRLGYQRIEISEKDGKTKKEQLIPVWDFIGTYESENGMEMLSYSRNTWAQCYFRQKKADSMLTIHAADGTVNYRSMDTLQ